MRDSIDLNGSPARREPAFNAPWPVLVLVATLIGAHALRLALRGSSEGLALTARDFASGGGVHLLTHLFVHGSWAHVLLNAVSVLAFGTPVARYLGSTAGGVFAFVLFFLVCGVIAALGFAGWASVLAYFGHPSPAWGLVGASGAASGLFGAATRLMGAHGRLDSLFSPRVLTLSLVWIVAMIVLGFSGLTPGAAGATVAWQAHVCGLLAGLVLIGPLAVLGQRPFRGNSLNGDMR